MTQEPMSDIPAIEKCLTCGLWEFGEGPTGETIELHDAAWVAAGGHPFVPAPAHRCQMCGELPTWKLAGEEAYRCDSHWELYGPNDPMFVRLPTPSSDSPVATDDPTSAREPLVRAIPMREIPMPDPIQSAPVAEAEGPPATTTCAMCHGALDGGFYYACARCVARQVLDQSIALTRPIVARELRAAEHDHHAPVQPPDGEGEARSVQEAWDAYHYAIDAPWMVESVREGSETHARVAPFRAALVAAIRADVEAREQAHRDDLRVQLDETREQRDALAEALRLIAARGCERDTRHDCWHHGRTADAEFGEDRACDPCVATRALDAESNQEGS